MVGHAAVDIVLDMSLFCRISQRFADGYLIAPRNGIDKCSVSTSEEFCYELSVLKGALKKSDIFEGFELLADGWCPLADMGSDFISNRPLASPCLGLGNVWVMMIERVIHPTAEATRVREAACRPVALTITRILSVM